MALSKSAPITIAAGHSGNYGAVGCGYREEILAKELVSLIVSGFKNLGYNIVDVSPKGSYGVSAQLAAEYNAANAVRGAQLHLCVHFNASNGAGHGTESWIYAHGNAANGYANAITNAIANCAGFTNRGVKASGNSLCIPRRVNQPVVLIETCFIDNRGDMDKYIANKAKIASAIVNSLTGGHVSVASPAPSKPANPTPAPANDPVKKGKEYVGSRCKELQVKLIKCGYSVGPSGADGDFGVNTYNALIKFQKDNGLTPDGLAGPATFAKLGAIIAAKNKPAGDPWIRRLQEECNKQGFSKQVVDGIAGPATLEGCPMLRQGARGNITKLLQERLNISADGIFGAGTKSRVINYQKSKGLTADGVVGKNTWRKLLGM